MAWCHLLRNAGDDPSAWAGQFPDESQASHVKHVPHFSVMWSNVERAPKRSCPPRPLMSQHPSPALGV